MITSLCIYCASSLEVDEKYKQAAREVGLLCARRGWRLVYGAGAEGLMGAACDACQQEGGQVTGVIPRWMIDRGWLRPGLDHLVVTDTMAQRKQTLRDISDAIVVLPGGYGTMDEFFETLTDKQMGRWTKPLVLLNQDGYYDHLVAWMRQCYDHRFVRNESDLSLVRVIDSTSQLDDALNDNDE